jgi:hypothetical protein
VFFAKSTILRTMVILQVALQHCVTMAQCKVQPRLSEPYFMVEHAKLN